MTLVTIYAVTWSTIQSGCGITKPIPKKKNTKYAAIKVIAIYFWFWNHNERHFAWKHQTTTQTRLSAKGALARLSLFSFTVIPPSSHTEALDLKKSNDLDKASWFRPWQKSFFLNESRAVRRKPSRVGQPGPVSRWLNGQIDGFGELIASLERHHLHLERRVVPSLLRFWGRRWNAFRHNVVACEVSRMTSNCRSRWFIPHLLVLFQKEAAEH